MTDLSIDQQIPTFLATCRTASLATVDDHGEPCAANLQYVSDDALRLYWVSSMSSAHSMNLDAKPLAALTIYAHQDSPETIHGLQMRGRAERLVGQVAERALSIYTAKYPFAATPPYSDAIFKQCFYRFTPTWLRWIDNRQGFGFKRELNL